MPSRVTVFTPMYNAQRYVRETVRSVLAQTWRDFEYLIIDDGSTDDSLRVVREAAADDPRVRIISRDNRGLIDTRNEGIREAQGEVLVLLDADDVAYADRIDKQMAYLQAHPECVAVGSRVRLIDPEGMPIARMIEHFSHEEIDGGNLSVQGIGSYLFNPTAAIRKAAMLRVGGYRKGFEWAEDFDLFLRLGEVGKLANLPEVLVDYRQHFASVGYSRSSLQRRATIAALREARERRGMPQSEPQGDMPILAPLSGAQAHRRWAWWALRDGNVPTARKHAWRAFSLEPWSREGVKLIYCAIRGR